MRVGKARTQPVTRLLSTTITHGERDRLDSTSSTRPSAKSSSSWVSETLTGGNTAIDSAVRPGVLPVAAGLTGSVQR